MADQNQSAKNGAPEGDSDEDQAVDLTQADLDAARADAADARPNAEAVVAELNDRILRLAAELENTRRRAARDKTDAGRYAIASFARDLLEVVDNFERALGAAGREDGATNGEALSSLIAGLQMTEKELLSTLERHGVRRIAPTGEKFDPNLHQAVAHFPDPKIPAGHVVDVAQPGFTIGDRVLRAAMVTVSSGAEKAAPNGTDDDQPAVDKKF